MTETGYLILGLISGGLLIAIALWLGRRREDVNAILLSKIEVLERAQERGERLLREEMTRGREENASTAKSQREELTAALESVRGIVDLRLQELQKDNAQQIERMRATVDEKLQGTLEKRLGESFKLVSERLEKVHQGLGAMQDLETQLKKSAKDICAKYINPPKTTDFALMFLPTEGLYAEAIRRVGLVEQVQRDCRVVFAGPTTLAALLNSLQMGFRTLAIQKRSSEVWSLLAGVKTEFGKFGDALAAVKEKLEQAARKMEDVDVRSRALTKKLRDVEELPTNPQPMLKDLLGGDEER